MMTKTAKKGIRIGIALLIMLMCIMNMMPGNFITHTKVEAYGESEDGYYYAETWLYDYDYDSSNFGYTRDNQQAYNNNSANVNLDWNGCHNLREGDRWMTGLQVPYETLNRDISAFYNGKNAPALYFGNFYGTATDIADTRGNGPGETPWQYTYLYGDNNNHSYADVYKNFWQSANNAPKTSNGNVAVQGLVDNTLNSNGTLTQNGGAFELPQFSDTFINSNSKMHKYSTSNGFPFNINNASNGIKTYEFDSSKDHKRYYENGQINVGTESNHPIGTVNWRSDNKTVTGGDYGFYPFNKSNITNMVVGRTAVNYGFGMKVNIPFNLSETGTLTDNNGNHVDAVFNFSGDDDVWVFVDGVLVLDIGGDHAKVSGSINFNRAKQAQNNTVYVSKVAQFTQSSNKYNRASETGTQNTSLPAQFTAAGKSFDYNTFYNPGTEHVLTVFYMERGMFESNLSISFNFAPVNPHKLTVKEKTLFDDVNPGLIKDTVAVADKDIFDYSIENKGTTSINVGNSGIYTPTYTYIDRNNTDSGNTGLINRLSGQREEYNPGGTVVDPDYIYLNPTWSGGTWDKDGAVLVAWAWKQGQNGSYIKFEKDSTTGLYRIPRNSYAGLQVRRFNGSNYPGNGQTNYNTGDAWNSTGDITVTNGKNKINITGWNSGSWDNSNVTITTEPTLKQVSHLYNPTNSTVFNPVGTTSYQLTDPYGVKTGTKTAETTLNRDTTSDGHFRLMYGEEAYFFGQFKKSSTMRVKQSDTLAKPKANRSTTMGSDNGTRKVKDYYSTTVEVVDYEDNQILYKNKNNFDSYNTGDGTYLFENDPDTISKTVHLKETYINRIKVGAVKFQKILDPAETSSQDFTFAVTFDDLFGDTSSDGIVNDYSEVEIYINGIRDYLDQFGEFTMKAGQTAYIKGIPVGTNYKIEEIIENNSNFEINYNSAQRVVCSGTVTESTEVNTTHLGVEVNKRRVGKLTVTKTVTDSGANTNDTFPVTVTLTAPAGVNMSDYIINEANNVESKTTITGLSISATVFSFNVKNGSSITFKNIPYGTKYTVSENAGNYTATVNYGDSQKIIDYRGANDTVSIINTLEAAVIRIRKVDQNNDPIKGARFAIYETYNDAVANTNAVNYALVNINTEGTEFTFSKLKVNRDYYFVELTPPPGYVKITEPIKISTGNDGTIYEKDVQNTPQIQMPETGVSFMIHPSVIGVSAVILAALALIIYRKRLQKAAVYTDEKGRYKHK